MVHGGGSFGHPPALKYRLQEGYRNRDQIRGFAEVSYAMRELNQKVLEALLQESLNGISIPGGLVAVCKKGEISQFSIETFKAYVDLETIPVTFGDVAIDTEQRFCICSGDQLMVHLARFFKPRLCVFVTDVDGIFEGDPDEDGAKLLKRLDDGAQDRFSSLPSSDATGGIAGKISSMLEIVRDGSRAFMLNGNHPERLGQVMDDKETLGTLAA